MHTYTRSVVGTDNAGRHHGAGLMMDGGYLHHAWLPMDMYIGTYWTYIGTSSSGQVSNMKQLTWRWACSLCRCPDSGSHARSTGIAQAMRYSAVNHETCQMPVESTAIPVASVLHSTSVFLFGEVWSTKASYDFVSTTKTVTAIHLYLPGELRFKWLTWRVVSKIGILLHGS